MDAEEIHENFLKLETEIDTFDITIDDVPIWERIRFNVHRQIMREEVDWGVDEPDSTSRRRRQARRLWMGLKNIVHRNPLFVSEHDILYWGHKRRKKLSDGLWWDIYCDPIHEALPEQDYVHFELPNGPAHHTPAKTPNLQYLDLIQVSVGIGEKLGLLSTSIPTNDKNKLGNISDEIESVYGVDVPVEKMVRDELTQRAGLRPMYRRLLKSVDPDVVVLVVHNGKETFIETCKNLGIPVVELQHGILTEYEYAYSYPGFRTKQTFPDYLFTWGTFWNDRVEFPINDQYVFPIGYPYLEMKADQYRDLTDTNQTLFISQPNIGKDFSKVACEVASNPRVVSNIVYKLHPYEYDIWESRYPWLECSGVDVIDSDNPSLYELFASSNKQVGVFSTAIYEGIYFDIDTILFNLPGVENLDHLYNNGVAEFAENTEQLVDHITQARSAQFDRSNFFEPDSMKNFEMILSKVIDGDVNKVE